MEPPETGPPPVFGGMRSSHWGAPPKAWEEELFSSPLPPLLPQVPAGSKGAWDGRKQTLGPGAGVYVREMPSTAQQPSGQTEMPTEPEAAVLWPSLPCGPCIPIMLSLASLAAFFLVTTAVLAERLLRRSLRRAPGPDSPTLVWRPGGELWIEPPSSARERSEDWYGSAMPLLTDRAVDPPTPGGTLEARATAPPAPLASHSPAPSSLLPTTIAPAVPAPCTFWGSHPWEERPHQAGLVRWSEPEPEPPPAPRGGGPPPWRPRPGSPEPDWSLQPRVTLEQISAFWRREGRTSSVGF
ncbi:transmembrane protein C16orf54 homolog isoform X2 [Ochotona curzoniae]|uniref:transmembrane protein C16orf54 homolog isoform X2 n=1 Tax=Ochotona curzoniae TaxID=130825 RepID=UPI001B348384|nr:transmembrane protein C16orf54 homolog isoform X2 [Ochotona curzoniae]